MKKKRLAVPKKANGVVQIQIPAMGWAPRDYQDPAWDYFDKGGKRGVLNWHRRCGKDLFALNLIAKMMTRRKGMYWHVYPTYAQGNKAIWESYTSDGTPYLAHLPEELRDGEDNTKMLIRMALGSSYQIVGADKPDSLRGPNPIGVVFSEYASMDPAAWDIISPILAENGGWALFISTPCGHNHFHKIYNYGESNPKWFCQTLTVDDTTKIDHDGKRVPVVPKEAIDEERGRGKSEAWILQEYWCKFDSPIEGSIFAAKVDEAGRMGRIGFFPYDKELAVHTAWDLGIGNRTVIIFYQLYMREVRVIDCYAASGEGIPHYANVLKEKNYRYGRHWAPWDIQIKELGTGRSRIEQAMESGIRFSVLRRVTVEEGIEACRSLLPQCFFHQETTGRLLSGLRGYKRNYDAKTDTYSAPVKDWCSDFADAFRYMAWSIKMESDREKPRQDFAEGKTQSLI